MTYDALPASKDAQRRNLGHFIYKDFALAPPPPPPPTYPLPSNLQLKLKKYFKKILIFSLVLEAKMENILKINFGLYN